MGLTVRMITRSQLMGTTMALLIILPLIISILLFGIGKLVGGFWGESIAGGQALGQKNTPFAIWIACTYLNPLSSVGPGCYILWQNIINSFEIWQERKKSEKTEIAVGEKSMR